MTEPFSPVELDSLLEKLRDLSATLSDGERAALNHIGRLAIDAADADTEGFAINDQFIGRGSAAGPADLISALPPAPHTPEPGGPVPVPYPNVASALSRWLPF